MAEESITGIADVHVGMRLEAMDKFGKWFMAKVVEVDEEEEDILVHFDGWSSRYDEYVDVKSGRLRPISPNTLQMTTQRKKSKPLNVGDRVQAKWQDGRMYFGKILSIGNDEVKVLFDDGVEYAAPHSHVRRRRPDRLPDNKPQEDYLKSTYHLSVAMDARRKRAKKRAKSDDSQSPLPSSPPSSPIFLPKRSKQRSSRILDDDSTTETDSDLDNNRERIHEKPILDCDESLGNDSSLDVPLKGADLKGISPSSSDSEQPIKRSKYTGLREPYKLRSGPGQLSPVSEDPDRVSDNRITSSTTVASAFLTPPLESQSPPRPSHVSMATSITSQLKMTPPETPDIKPGHFQTSDGKIRLSVSVPPGFDGVESMLYCEESSRFLRDKLLGFDSDTSSEPSTLLRVPSTTSLLNLDPLMTTSSLTLTHLNYTRERRSSNLLRETRSPSTAPFFSSHLNPPQKPLHSDDTISPQMHVPLARDACISICSSPMQETRDNPPPFPSSHLAPGSQGRPQKTKKTKHSKGGVAQTSGTDSNLVSVTVQALASVTSTSKPSHKTKSSPKISEEKPSKVSLKTSSKLEPSHKVKPDPKASLVTDGTLKPSHKKKQSPKSYIASEEKPSHKTKISLKTPEGAFKKTTSTLTSEERPSLKKKSSPKSLTAEGTSSQGVAVKASARLAARGREGEAKRSLSDSSVLSPAHKGHIGKKRAASVTTRNRAQTMFENMMKKSERNPAKLAPKELVIVWDHNEHKCKFMGCNKSFRKESLLLSHVKHYHNIKPKTPIKGKEKGPGKEKSSAKSPLSPKSLRSPRSSSPPAPKSPELKSILSPPSKCDLSKGSNILRRSKSPTESFFETIERQQNSAEVFGLLEQSMKQQPAAIPIKGSGTHRSHSMQSPGHTSPQPLSLELNRPRLKSGSGGTASKYFTGKAPPKLSTVQPEKPLNIITHPLRFPLVEIKSLPREALPLSPKKSPPFTSKGSQVGISSPTADSGVHHQTEGTSRFPEAMAEDAEDQDVEMRSLSPTESEDENSDDVVHCICGSIVDEGFMIQCEQCLCWQHGDCIGITKETLPEKYVCCICTNPPGLRLRMKYRFDRDWFADGILPSFPGAPKFTETATMRRTHCLADAIYKLKKMAHSTKVKLQAASTPNHPYLKQWMKECSHLTRDDFVAYLLATLQPMSHDSLTEEQNNCTKEAEDQDGTKETAARMSPSSPNENTSFGKPIDEQVLTGSSVVGPNNKDSLEDNTEKRSRSSSSPVDVTDLCLDPLPLDTGSSYPPVSSPQHLPNNISLETTPDPKTLQLAPLPPLSSEEIHQIASLVLKSTAAGSSHQTSTTSSDLSSSVEPSLSIPSSSLENLPSFHPPMTSISSTSIPHSETPNPVASKEAKSASFDSVISDSEFNGGFGIQETSVFALDEQPDIKHPKTIRTEPLGGTLSSLLPISPGKLLSSQKSAFKPVTPPSSQLASLLAGKALNVSPHSTPLQQNSTHRTLSPSDSPPSLKPLPSVSCNSNTALGSCGLQHTVDTNPVFSETVSSLSTLAMTTMNTVPLRTFVEAFLHTDGRNWCQRMLLLDHIEAVQDKIAAWMDSIHNQLQGMPCEEGEMEDIASLLKDVQSTIRELSRIQQTIVTNES